MLTSDLVRARRRGAELTPLFLNAEAKARVLPACEAMVAVFAGSVGRSREDLEAALDAISVAVRDRQVCLGLRKLCEDRATFEVRAPLDPETVRRALFFRAAAAYRALGLRERLDREGLVAEVAASLSATPEAVEESLFGDLHGAERLVAFDPVTATALLERYDLALAQGMLIRARKVVVRVEGESPARYRALFRALRFHGLLHRVEGELSRGFTLVIDGPLSLFGPVQRYGVRLALALPAILACRTFHLRAEVAWGPAKDVLTFELSPKDGLAPSAHAETALSPELEAFCAAFARLESDFQVAPAEDLLPLDGQDVVIPDLVFTHGPSGQRVFLEAFGFWSRAAVWRRVEQVQAGRVGQPLILAAGKQLRVSEEVLGEDDAAELYVYGAAMSARAVLERLGRLVDTGGAPRKKPRKKKAAADGG